jgi:O-antigen/teichoic acid export membrane protein
VSQRRNLAFAFGGQGATVLFTAVLTLFLIRTLGELEYGEFAIALAVGGLVLLPADLGISASAARFLAEARDDPSAREAVAAAALRLKLAVSTVVTLVLWLLAPAISAAYAQPGLAWPIRGVALAVLGQSVLRLCTTCAASQQRNSVSFRLILAESAAETIASIGFVVLGAGAAGAAFGRATGYLLGSVLGILALARVLDISPARLVRRPKDRGARRRIAGYAGAIALVDMSWALFSQIDILLIGALLSSSAAGVFQAPMRILTLASYPGIALGSTVGPRLVRSGGGAPGDSRPLLRAARLLLIGQSLAAAFALAWAVPLTKLVLGDGYGGSAIVLAVLAPYLLLGGLAPLLSNAIDYVGGTRRRVVVAVVALLTNTLLDVILLPRVGVVGAAIGTDVGYTVFVVGHLVVCSRTLGFSLRGLAVSALRCLAAAAAASGVLLITVGSGPIGLCFGAVAALTVFGTVLLALGEVSLRTAMRRPRTSPPRRLATESAPRASKTAPPENGESVDAHAPALVEQRG